MKTRLLLLAGVLISSAILFAQQSPADLKAIDQQLGKLRQMPDDQRAKATRQLALQIRALLPGTNKVGLAQALANLSTEGDFGHDTLQEVADTLAQSVRETPVPSKTADPAAPYMELAQLARYEHINVQLSGPEYAAAVKQLDGLEADRAKADFTLNDIDGKTWTRSSLRGKVVLVNFWATWCPPCRKEMPDIQALYERFKSKGLVVLAISDEESGVVRSFVGEHKFSFPILLDPGRKVNERYHVDGIPKSFVYDRGGKLVAQSIDMRTQRQFLELLAQAGLK